MDQSNRIVEYDVICGNFNIKDLIVRVNIKISEGWIPLGGICVDGARSFQSMIKYPQAAQEVKRLMAEGDQAKLRGDFVAANTAYTDASRLVT
jgi:hypothetical protein